MEDVYSDDGRLPIRRLTEYALKQNPKLFDKPTCTEEQKALNKKHSAKWLSENRLSNAISASMRNALYGNKNGYHWEALVNYNLPELRKHLQKQFTDGMSWDNYGEWEIDHVIPVSAFTFASPDDIDFKRCWSLANLRPLWMKDNRSKGKKIIKPFQISLQGTASLCL